MNQNYLTTIILPTIKMNLKWVENEDQLDEIWRDLISSEYIRDILQQLDENVTNIQENSNLLPEYVSSAKKHFKKLFSG